MESHITQLKIVTPQLNAVLYMIIKSGDQPLPETRGHLDQPGAAAVALVRGWVGQSLMGQPASQTDIVHA